MSEIALAIHEVAQTLTRAGIVEARREARLLVAAAAGLSAATVIAHPELKLDQAQCDRLAALARRRQAREPISRILGWREFWSLRFALGPDTLDPRPDSETLIAAALESADHGAALSVLDLGTGSGCLLLALLSELPMAKGLGIDLSPGALAVALSNAESLGLASRCLFRQGDWGSAIAERFDLILCNPPYIPAGEIGGLAPEVANFDPVLALAGGADGLGAYRRLRQELPRLLLPGARAIVEIGAGQAGPVASILVGGGLVLEGQRADLAGTPRCLILAQGPAGPGRYPQNRPKKQLEIPA